MITGNFAVNICDVHTRIDYSIEPDESTFNNYSFIVYPDNVLVQKTETGAQSVFLETLINLVYTRIEEQTNLKPKYVGINIK